ncbi:helix-turn-helix transcriptional regulator [Paenibacillus lutimineralis]|uniref:WYL domain-containing protein n=1 Tax=Paenibacillus lutimineralis TaxID=2707005 RepID=A0A3Q9IAQ7_9BACL|nr:WYL domain-containing protein [Paenibacillus lutimineralis]AZS16412.1 WYL domain-containing protein [Paenibacillus lutimineralis]
MKRMDRMMAIVLALQHQTETAQSLADKLEVSKRTILRDVQALSEIGVPIYAVSGPGGGYRLMEGYRLPPLQLDTEEALVLLLALDGMMKYSDSPFQQARWTVRDKICSVLPEHTLGQITPLLGHVEMEVPDRRYKTPYLSELMKYAANGQWLLTLYRSQNHSRQLNIRPLRVYAAYGFWYCEAYSSHHGEVRTFRVDRFVEVEASSMPESEVEHELGSLSSSKEATVFEQSVHIYAKLTYRGALLAEQDPHMGHLVKQTEDEEWEVAFDCPASEWSWAVDFFYYIGLDAEVLEPVRLQEEIRAKAEQLVRKYSSND